MRLPFLLLVLGALSFGKPMPVAFCGGFTSSSADTSLTDLNIKKGVDVFFENFPQAKADLEFVYFDNEGDLQKTVELANKIVATPFKVIVGISKSSQALAIQKTIASKPILFFTPMATHDDVTQGFPNIFRGTFSDSTQGKALAAFATHKLAAKKILILTNLDSPYSIGLSDFFQNGLKRQTKIQVVKYLNDTTDYSPVEKQVAEFKPDVIFIPDYSNRAAQIVEWAYPKFPTLTYLGGDGWGSREVMDAKLAVFKELKAYYSAHWVSDYETPENALFMKGYRKLYPDLPYSQGCALTYDTLRILWKAYQDSHKTGDFAAMKKALTSQTFQATTGAVRYKNPSNPTPERQVAFVKLSGGKHTYVRP